MAKVTSKNVFLHGLSGSIGDLVFRQMPDGSTRVSAKPDFRKRKPSQKQKDTQERFKRATRYARDAKTQPIYIESAKGTTKNAYNWALSDWFNPPVIHRIERNQGVIRVMASDNVMVTKVHIRILNGEGHTLEEGQAKKAGTQDNPEWWEYVTSVGGTVEATAWDLAENQVTAVL